MLMSYAAKYFPKYRSMVPLTHFNPIFHYIPLENVKKPLFSDIFRGYRNAA